MDGAGTVYGGTLDVTTGVLTVAHGNIASYGDEILPGAWISRMDVYSTDATPTAGVQVVYELATPQTCQLTPQEVLPGRPHHSLHRGNRRISRYSPDKPKNSDGTGGSRAVRRRYGSNELLKNRAPEKASRIVAFSGALSTCLFSQRTNLHPSKFRQLTPDQSTQRPD